MSFFGKNIRKIRSIRKISQTEFANIFDISRASVGSYEEGRAEPKIEIISNVAKYFSITIDELINKELTVNDLYHFDVGSEPVFKTGQARELDLIQIPFYQSTKLSEILERRNENKNKTLTIPELPKHKNLAAVLIQANSITDRPSIFSDNETLILDLQSINIKSDTFYLVKTNNAIYISKLIELANQKIYLSQVKNEILILDRKDLELCLPIVQRIGGVHAMDTSNKINDLELKIDQLIKKIYQ